MIKPLWQPDALRRFWDFIAKRHMMFRRRVILKEAPPWTLDPVLDTIYFTNIYRELDRGTRYVINHLIEGRADAGVVFFNIVAYRAFNVIGTHRILAAVLGILDPPRIAAWNLSTARSALVAAQKEGVKIFTGAFLITGSGQWSGRGGKIGLVCENLTKIWRQKDTHARTIMNSVSLQDAHRYLTQLPGIGRFMAYELVCDFMYKNSRGWNILQQFTEDDWVNMGPGARRGLWDLTGEHFSQKDGAVAIAELRDMQETWLVAPIGPRLTLRAIEHSLCEFQKYERSRTGGRAKRKFNPGAASTDFTPWANLPKKFL